MDRGLALAALAAIPALAALFYGLAQGGMRPLTACLVGLCAYWLLLLAALFWRRDWSLHLRWPGWRAALPLTALTASAAIFGGPAIPQLSPHVLVTVLIAACINGTLEEAFWRGALVPRANWQAALPAVGLFTLWHLAPAAAMAALDAKGGAPGLLIAAALLGICAMATRLASGSAGFAALCHVAINICTFAVLAATNGSARFP
ncbi:CPBP family glutamic-type intramembrane protease [Paracoccus litorisediminis]|uniref:CPBP family intramembrane metalloprotease n=1 Tax=Paracoccus litorisediminis TaxID=2006130 RepID=A0A844HFP2_9RHOB|nr:CPBP family glutamic-type intramembrane protease [Paracoccus litorisediminis]MTH58426.1 CPBP family intramembrane metalloprotease [Paracoccus litorisediminis]